VFHEAYYRREAYGKFIPEEVVEDYVEWYVHPPTKADDSWFERNPNESFYGDDWWLMEHKDFYNTMVDMKIWQPRDFSLVPTKKVFTLYKTWKGLPLGQDRRDFEAKHPDLDMWLHKKFGTKLESEREKGAGRKEAEPTPWEKAEEAKRMKEWIESL
jgi:hypothetical protein